MRPALISYISSGCFGEVWKVSAGALDQVSSLAALKISYRPFDSEDIRNELPGIKLAISLENSGLVPLKAVFEYHHRLAVLMDLADCTLSELIKGTLSKHVPLPRAIVDCLLPVAKTLDSLAEQRIVHCGVTPNEVLIFGGSPRLIDFSIMHSLDKPFPQVFNLSLLTWSCMSPEVRNKRPSLQSDQYSLAASYLMLRGSDTPYREWSLTQYNLASLGSHERRVVTRALSEHPNSRFDSSSEFMDELDEAIRMDCH